MKHALPIPPRAQPRPRQRALPHLLGMALATLASPAVFADSAVGSDTSLGNALHPAPINPITVGQPLDPDGLGGRLPASRTPTGQMYRMPQLPADTLAHSTGGWQYLSFVEVGVLHVGGDRKAQGFRRYKDADNGLYLSRFAFSAEKPDDARYVEIVGGAVGRDDQYYGATFGRYNDWRVRAFFNETPHVFTTSFRNLWNGAGSDTLTLKPGLTAGGTASIPDDHRAVEAVASANAESEFGLTRKKGGLRLDMTLTDQVKVFAAYTLEKREGARPFGSVWGGGGGSVAMELLEPIDYDTHDIQAGLYYNDKLNSFNLQTSASLFRNNISTLTFETPYRVAAANGIPAGGFTQGRFDLYPDNEAYNVKAEYARKLPELMNGRFNATVSLGTSRQDDKLIPYTTLAGVSVPNVIGNNWDSLDALSRSSADARIDTRLIDLGLALQPAQGLNVKAKARYYETRNHTRYLACNPNARYRDLDAEAEGDQEGAYSAYGCTGVWGRLINDGSGVAMLQGANATTAGNVNIASIPFDYRRLNTGLTADWRLTPQHSANAAYDREAYHRDHRERDRTAEDKLKLGYVNRGLPDTTLRLSYGYDKRRGSRYHTHDPYADFTSGTLVAMPTAAGSNVQTWVVHMNSGLRKYDLADRNQQTLNARINYTPRDDFDLGLALQSKRIDYPDAAYGRRDRQRLDSLNLDLDWQQSAQRSLYAYYAFQTGQLRQRGVPSGGGIGCLIGLDTPYGTITPDSAGQICQNPASNTVFVADNFWDLKHRDRSNTVGVGLRQQIGKAHLDVNYTYARTTTAIDYRLPANANEATRNAAGNGFPDLLTLQNIFEANLLMPVNKTVSARLLLRHERGKYNDWHYSGLQDSPVAVNAPGTALPTAVILDAGTQNYRSTLIGLMFQVRL